MSFLDKPLSEMSLSDIQRLISVEVSAQIPAIPTGVRDLGNLDVPLVMPDVNLSGQVLTYNQAANLYQPATVTSATPGTDGATPGTPVVTLTAGPGWIQASWPLPGTTHDPLKYKVFARSGSAPTTADDTYLVGTTTALSFVFAKLTDGTQITDTGTYHVKVIAISQLSGGVTGAASTDVSGSPLGVDGSVLTVSNVHAANIITGNLTAVLTVTAGSLQTSASGKRVVMDSTGLTVYGDDGATTVVSIPTAVGTDSSFSGSLLLTSDVVQPLFAAGLAVSAGGSLTGTTQYFFSFAWYDGTHETQPSPVSNATTTGTNKTITITIPAAPRPGLQARVYMNTATFGAGGGHLQSATAVSSSTTTAIAFTTYNSGGAASQNTNTFAYATALLKPSTLDASGNAYGFLLAGDGRIRFLGPTINLQTWFYTDFFGSNHLDGQLVETVSGAGAGATNASGSQVNPGVVNMTTGTATTGTDDIAMGSNAISLGTMRTRCSFYFQIPTIQDSTNTYQIQLGLADATTVPSTAGNHNVVFTFQTAGGSPVMALGLRTNDGATTTFVNAVDASGATFIAAVATYYLCEFEVNAAGTSIDWWVNGVKQTAKTTNIPTAHAMALRASIIKTASTTARTMLLDAMGLYGDFAS